jgi:hypothetical protein
LPAQALLTIIFFLGKIYSQGGLDSEGGFALALRFVGFARGRQTPLSGAHRRLNIPLWKELPNIIKNVFQVILGLAEILFRKSFHIDFFLR